MRRLWVLPLALLLGAAALAGCDNDPPPDEADEEIDLDELDPVEVPEDGAADEPTILEFDNPDPGTCIQRSTTQPAPCDPAALSLVGAGMAGTPTGDLELTWTMSGATSTLVPGTDLSLTFLTRTKGQLVFRCLPGAESDLVLLSLAPAAAQPTELGVVGRCETEPDALIGTVARDQLVSHLVEYPADELTITRFAATDPTQGNAIQPDAGDTTVIIGLITGTGS